MNSIENTNMKTALRNRLTLWAMPLVFLLAADVAGQQPKRHFVSQSENIRRIPSSFDTRSDSENDFVGRRKTPKAPEIIKDHLVRPAAFNDGKARPIRDMATITNRRAEDLPWTYQLQNLDYSEFEAKLADIWGDRMLGTPLDQQQRMLRLFLPEGKTAPEASIKFDRVSGMLTYEGAPNRKQGFQQLMRAIDRRPDAGRYVKVIDVSTVEQDSIKQVVALFQDEQQPQNPSVEIPSNISQEQIAGIFELPEIKGRLTVRQNRETNTVYIESTVPEDAIAIEKFLAAIQKDPGMFKTDSRSIQLFNENAASILENIQELYDGRFAEINGPALIDASMSTNSIIVVGNTGALDAVEKLVRQFDGRPIDAKVDPPGTEQELSPTEKGFQKFTLQHVSADEAERAVLTLYNQNPSANLAQQPDSLQIQVIVDRRGNAITVVGSQIFIRRAAALIKELDQPPSKKTAERILRVFKIRNHAAADFQVILQDTLNGQFQNQATQAVTESQLNQQNAGGQGQVQDGQPVIPQTNIRFQRANGEFMDVAVDFFDVRINSDSARNTITVVAPEEAMPVIAEIIAELDKLPDLFSEVKVIPVIHGDASEILATLSQIFTGDGTGAGQGGQGGGGLGDLPLQSPGGDGASLINIRFAVNERTNTIIASGSPSDLDFVFSLVRRLDEPDRNERQTVVYRLSNASVVDVEAALDAYLADRQTLIGSNPILGAGTNNSGVTAGRRDVSISVEPTSNQIIVAARPEYFPEIDALINRLDRRPPMIKVKAQIVQVDLNQLENFGVEFGVQDSAIFGAGLSDMIGSGFIGLDNVAGQVVSDLGVGRSNAGGVPGFLLSAGDDSLNFVLRFLKQKGFANVLFSPEIMTLENLTGNVNVGSSIQRATGTNAVVGAGVTQGFEEVPIGITLNVTPRVSPDGMIVMFVDVSNSSLGPDADGTVIGTDMFGAQIISRPINQTVAQTTIMARSGQTVAISGLFQEEKSQIVTSVPFLGDLPVIGPLFQSVENTADRTELLIILTPYVVDGTDDISALNKDDFDRMHWCESDVAELHGTTSYTGQPYREQARKVIYPDSDPMGRNPEFAEDNGGLNFDQPQNNQNFSNGEDQWDGEGEQIFPPREDRFENQDQGSGSRSLEDNFNDGSSNRNQLPMPISQRTQRTATRNHSQDISRRSATFEGTRSRRSYDARTEYMDPPYPTQRQNRVGQSQAGPSRRVISYPDSSRYDAPGYQMNDNMNGQSSNYSRR